MEKKAAQDPYHGEVSVESGQDLPFIDEHAERSYVRKMDMYLLPFMSLMYFFNSVDRSNLGNAKTDGLTDDLGFKGNEYSFLILFFYIPNGLFDLPLNLLTKKLSGKVMLPSLMLGWGCMALIQCGASNFAGMMTIRLILAIFEAGFFAGSVFYLTLFYTRGELSFRIALFFGSALLASAFSGLISYGVFQINDSHVKGWQWLFIIEGGLTVVVSIVAFFWLPSRADTAWFLNDAEKAAARVRLLRDASQTFNAEFNLKAAFATWHGWKFWVWCAIAFTYSVAFTTTANFLPQVVERLGFSDVKTNLWTVAPNAVGFVILLCVTKSSDYFRERTFHLVFSLCLSMSGMIVLAVIDVLAHKGVAYFAMFLMAGGAYIPSCIIHSWHNNNNLEENSRAATTGLLAGLSNLSGVICASTFRTEYSPNYIPTLIATCCCNATCICATLALGLYMKRENRARDRQQGVTIRAEDVDTSTLHDGEKSPNWRFFT